MSLESFVEILGSLFGRGGGRRASEPNMESPDEIVGGDGDRPWYMEPPRQGESKLTIVQITDVYTLDNFASLKTMLQQIRESQGPNGQVVSMLTGDFLMPYLLSSIDRGAGMMMALKETPIDILTWGNHEADIPHAATCKHVKDWPGLWINSNMQSHDMMKYQVPYHIIELPSSEDGSQQIVRKIGLVAVLSNDPKLYSHFKSPGAFGGATIEDPWETLRYYEKYLTEEHGCDLVLPLEHLYIPENIKTCQDFCFPLVLSGHDHHRIDQTIHGTRLIKPGMDGVHAAVVEISWPNDNASSDVPRIRNAFVEVATFPADPLLKKKTDAAYDVLAPLRNTELAMVPPHYFPLSSKKARAELCTVGRLVCDFLRASLEQSREPGESRVDAVILMGGNIRGGEDYPEDSFFSLEMLEAEIKSDEVVGVVPIPGSVLAAGIESTHQGDPKPGWMQFDEGIVMDDSKNVVMVAGAPLDPHRIYRVATKISDLTNGQSPPLKEYFLAHRELFPSKGDYINIQSELMGFFARNLFRKLWKATGKHMSSDDLLDLEEEGKSKAEMLELESQLRFSVLDQNGDGILSVEDIHVGLRDYLGLSVYGEEMKLAKIIHDYADVTENGYVTVDDFEVFCTGGLPKEFRPLKRGNSINKAFPEPVECPPESSSTTTSSSLTGLSGGSQTSEQTDGQVGLSMEISINKELSQSDTSLTGPLIGQ
jgi:2',3'-cyclic-nucleotide 2'-phosphodiesterase (5'-nucleotidase family)